jgi:glycosyltransferase involved in cell wall biosynthesis
MKFCLYNITTTIKIGGIETYYWEVSKELKNRGFDVYLVAGTDNKNIKYSDIALKTFAFTPRNKILDLGNRFKKFGERVSFFLKAKKYLKNNKFDIFLVRKPFDFFVCYFIKKWHKNIKTVFVSGGEDFYFFDKFFIKYIDHIFAVSNNNAKILNNRYNKNIIVVHNGVDTDKFTYNEKFREEFRKQNGLENKKIVVSAGRIVGWKGLHLIIESLTTLKDFYYVVIGDGDNLNNLKHLTQTFKVEDRVLFLGSVDNKKLPDYLSIGDVFVQPSIGHEAFGITLVEAMSCGLPIVASKNGGMVDIVEQGKNGYMFDNKNIKQMREEIILAYNNKAQISANSRAIAIEYFSWKNSVNKLLSYVV